ncbi:MAG: hypothetical protein AVDCRST_MAG79-1451, partial [uncultured Thermoleophilia bacterium]
GLDGSRRRAPRLAGHDLPGPRPPSDGRGAARRPARAAERRM